MNAGKKLHLKSHFLFKQELERVFLEVVLDITAGAKLLLAFIHHPLCKDVEQTDEQQCFSGRNCAKNMLENIL